MRATVVQEYTDHLPRALAQDPAQLGAWLYSCEQASHDEEAAMSETLPDLPLQVSGGIYRITEQPGCLILPREGRLCNRLESSFFQVLGNAHASCIAF